MKYTIITIIVFLILLLSCIKQEDHQFLELLGTIPKSTSYGNTEYKYYHHYLFIGDKSLDSYLDIARKYADTCMIDTPIVGVVFVDKNPSYFEDNEFWFSLDQYNKVGVLSHRKDTADYSIIEYYLKDEVIGVRIDNDTLYRSKRL